MPASQCGAANREGIVIGINFSWQKCQASLAISLSTLALLVCGPLSAGVAAPVCTVTGFFRDSINMTAALINPDDVSVDVDATGCTMRIHYSDNVRVW